ncbi:hypothetical protein FBU30_007124 [Linnemannia zychae]|nr:hypothetical protein FBU30_007124 [Linnemannia zychae]
MSSKNGQILYLGGSSGAQGNGGGSLSTRFQKLSQSRNSGITVVNPSTGIESRPGRSLGLGFGTGTHSSQGGSSTSGRGKLSTGGITGSKSGGLHTPGGLARAMQERGTGVSDSFLFMPTASIGGGGPSRREKRQNVAAAHGAPVAGTRANRHKAMVLGGRPGKKHNPAPAVTPQHKQGKYASQVPTGGKSAVAKAAKAAKAVGGGPAGKQKGAAPAPAGKKGKKGQAKPAPANAGDLDMELNEYMMKDERTAASMLDNDLDSYMADKPAENAW